MSILSEISVSNIGKMIGEALINLQRDGKLNSGSWICVNASNGVIYNNVNSQARKDFELYAEKVVNASKYSAARDKVVFF